MSVEKIIQEWKAKKFRPIYWLEGEEPYHIDLLMQYAENNLLSPAEAEFNLTVFYGKDAEISNIIKACRRYPMFAERQVVILREAQMMRDVEGLMPYIENPQPSTVFVVGYKDKKLDGRKQMAKLVAKTGELFSTKKLYDNQLPAWVEQMVQEQGLTINPRAQQLLVDHIGNDLGRLFNETVKLAVNLGKRKNITEDDIAEFIGVSKEFNVFELQKALAAKNHKKTLEIISFFAIQEKDYPFPMVVGSLYNFFSKLVVYHYVKQLSEPEIASELKIPPFPSFPTLAIFA